MSEGSNQFLALRRRNGKVYHANKNSRHRATDKEPIMPPEIFRTVLYYQYSEQNCLKKNILMHFCDVVYDTQSLGFHSRFYCFTRNQITFHYNVTFKDVAEISGLTNCLFLD